MYSYPHHIGDFIRDTSRLTDSQAMTYLRLIWMYYDTENPLPKDPNKLAFMLGASPQDTQAILEHFFFEDGQTYRHKRCDAEIEAYRSRQDHGRKAATARWKNAQSIPDASDGHTRRTKNDANREPRTDNREPIKKTSAARGTRLPQDFQLPGDWIAFCTQQRPELDAREVFEGFRDYWVAQPGQKGVKTDWTATWRNWVRRQQIPKKTAAEERRDQMAQLTRGLSVPKAKPFWAKDDNVEVIANVEPKGLL